MLSTISHCLSHFNFNNNPNQEDPAESFDQGVDNPFKNPDITKDGEGDDETAEEMKIDPARLLGPRLQGSNLYLVGMMGSGKSVIGDSIARRR